MWFLRQSIKFLIGMHSVLKVTKDTLSRMWGRVVKFSQKLEALTAIPENLSLVSGTHMQEGETELP